MNAAASLMDVVDPVISLVPRTGLRDALHSAFSEEQPAAASIEEFFGLLPAAAWSIELRRTFASSWKATHLKMLAIYGLSCRLQRAANGADEPVRSSLYVAAARNAETSYEDLGLDFNGETHADLYERFAAAVTGDDSWQLPKYRLPEAREFSRWIYRNMVVEDVSDGLLTNMFSEIYNHGEYSIALPAADEWFERHTNLTRQERTRAITYISAHVEDDTEKDHFLVVVDALERYQEASGTQFDAIRAERLFRAYLRNLAPVMRQLTARMQAELAGQPAEVLVATNGMN